MEEREDINILALILQLCVPCGFWFLLFDPCKTTADTPNHTKYSFPAKDGSASNKSVIWFGVVDAAATYGSGYSHALHCFQSLNVTHNQHFYNYSAAINTTLSTEPDTPSELRLSASSLWSTSSTPSAFRASTHLAIWLLRLFSRQTIVPRHPKAL